MRFLTSRIPLSYAISGWQEFGAQAEIKATIPFNRRMIPDVLPLLGTMRNIGA